MVVNWREKKECGHDAKEGTDKDSVYSSVPLKSVGLNLLFIAVADPREAAPVQAPYSPKCFLENLAKSYVGAPLPRWVGALSYEGSWIQPCIVNGP